MQPDKELFSHAATILAVKDIEGAISFYRDKIGFSVEFMWEDPVSYAVLVRGDVSLHLSKRQDDNSSSLPNAALYIFVYDVDAVHEELMGKGVEIYDPIGDREYQMRDFSIKDSEGFILTFGRGIR